MENNNVNQESTNAVDEKVQTKTKEAVKKTTKKIAVEAQAPVKEERTRDYKAECAKLRKAIKELKDENKELKTELENSAESAKKNYAFAEHIGKENEKLREILQFEATKMKTVIGTTSKIFDNLQDALELGRKAINYELLQERPNSNGN